MKKKHWIIFLIVLLVVLNISTYCGYNRIHRNYNNPKIERSDLDSIQIVKINNSRDSIVYPTRTLNKEQTKKFTRLWNKQQRRTYHVFDPQYKMTCYFKDQTTRTYDCLGPFICESYPAEGRGANRLCFDFIDMNYFEKLYAESK